MALKDLLEKAKKTTTIAAATSTQTTDGKLTSLLERAKKGEKGTTAAVKAQKQTITPVAPTTQQVKTVMPTAEATTKPTTKAANSGALDMQAFRKADAQATSENAAKPEKLVPTRVMGAATVNLPESQVKPAQAEGQYMGRQAVQGTINAVKGLVNAPKYLDEYMKSQDKDYWSAMAKKETDPQKAAEYQAKADVLVPENPNTVNWGENYAAETQRINPSPSKAAKVVGDVASGITGMIPTLVSNFIVPGSGLYVLGVSAGTQAAEDAYKNGADIQSAVQYGTAVGVIEAATEKMFNGLGKAGELMGLKGAADEPVKKVIKSIVKNKTAQKAVNYLVGALGEGFEEYVSEFGDAYANKLLVKQDERDLKQLNKDALYSMMIGGLVSAVIQTSNVFEKGGQVTPDQLADIAAAQTNEELNNNIQSSVQPVTTRESQTAEAQQAATGIQTPTEAETITEPQSAAQPVQTATQAQTIQAEQTQPVSVQQQRIDSGEVSANFGTEESHIDNRTNDTVASRNVKSFQFDYPELHKYFVEAAKILANDADVSIASQRSEYGKGTTSVKSEALNKAMKLGLTREQVKKVAEDIINNNGQENYAAAKRVELILDNMLSKGYPAMNEQGYRSMTEPNAEYVAAKSKIAGGTDPNSFEQYLKDNEFLLDLGEVTEDELRTEWEREEASRQQSAQPTSAQPAAYADVEVAADNVTPTVAAAEPVQRQTPEGIGAASKGFDPYFNLKEKYGTIKEGEEPRTEERAVSVPQQTTDTDKVRRFARTALESKVVDNPTAESIEKAILDGKLSYEPVSDASARTYADNKISSNFQAARKQWDSVVNGQKTATKKDIALSESLLVQAIQAKDTQEAVRLVAEISAEGTRAGQIVQSMRLLKRMDGAGQLYYIERVADNIQKQIDQNNKLAGKYNVEIPEELKQRLIEAGNDQAQIDSVMNDIKYSIAQQIPTTFWDKLNAWRYLAMLFNPRTHIRNIAGNAVFMPAITIKNYIGSALESIAGESTQKTKAIKADKTYKDFAAEDAEAMKNVLTGGGKVNPSNEIQDMRTIFKTKWLEAVRKSNFKALEIEDWWFLKSHYKKALSQYLQANNVDLTKAAENSETLGKARSYATNEALKATYRDMSSFANAVSKLANTNAATRIAVEGVLPFKKTPTNILKRGLEYSPLGLAKELLTLGELNKSNYATEEMRRQAVSEKLDKISEGLTGSGITMLGILMQSLGLITVGSGDDKEDKYSSVQGVQQYALKIGDYTYTIDWMVPIAIPLFLGAEIGNAIEQKGLTFSEAYKALLKITEPMFTLSMLSGFENTISSVSYTDDNLLTTLMLSMGMNYVSQYVPTLSGQISRTIDPTRRVNYAQSGQLSDMQYYAEKLKNKIPGLSFTSEPYVDVWGRTDTAETTGQSFLNAFQNFISPGYISKYQTSDMEEELKRLYKETGETVFPTKPAKYFTINGERKDLTSEEYSKMAKTQGEYSYDLYTAITETKAYKTMTDAEKVKTIQYAHDLALAKGKKAVSYYVSSTKWIENYAKSNATKLAAGYIIQKAIKATTDDNNEDARNGKAVADMTDTEKSAYYAKKFKNDSAEIDRLIKAGATSQDILSDMSESAQDKYNAFADEADISAAMYAKAYYYKGSMTSDKDEDGDTIANSKRDKVAAYVNKLDLSDEQKDAMMLSLGYAESGLWTMPWWED